MRAWLRVSGAVIVTTLAIALLYRLVAHTWSTLGAGMLLTSPFLITRIAWQQYRSN